MQKHFMRFHRDDDFNDYVFVRVTYHKCKLCSTEMKFNHTDVANHVRRVHKISFKQYKDEHGAIIDDEESYLLGLRVPKNPNGKPKPAVKQEKKKVTRGEWWYGNTFKCLVCAFESHSYVLFNTHTIDEHGRKIDDFQDLFTKTENLHECIICDLEVYHDKHFIEAHLANHTVSLKKYRDRWASREQYRRLKAERQQRRKERHEQRGSSTAEEPEEEEEDEDIDYDCMEDMMSMELVESDETFMEIQGSDGEEDGECDESDVTETEDPNSSVDGSVSESTPVGAERPRKRRRTTEGDLEGFDPKSLHEEMLSKCRLCGKNVLLNMLESHLSRIHKMSGDDYKEKTGEITVFRAPFHRCNVCKENIRFNLKKILHHLQVRHNLDKEQYLENHPLIEEGEQTQVYSDDINDMCTCSCGVCGKEMVTRALRDHVTKFHDIGFLGYKEKYGLYDFVKTTHHKCKVCGMEMKFTEKNIRHHIKFTHALGWVEYKTRFLDDVGPQDSDRVLTDDMNEMCRVVCRMCDLETFTHLFRKHYIRKHEENKHKHGDFKYVKKTFHKCKLCSTELLFTYETVYNHMKRCHNISLKQYEIKFKALIPIVGGKDFSRTCDVSADATGILNDSDTIDQEVLAAEMADKEMEDTKEMED